MAGDSLSGPVLLDIDVDFMFYPRTTGNPYAAATQRAWIGVQQLIDGLKNAGVRWDNSCSASVIGFLDHSQAYWEWKFYGYRGATVIHVDAHSDFYETFAGILHAGNYLGKSMDDGVVARTFWIVPDWLRNDWSLRRFDLEGVVRGKYHGKVPVTVATLNSLRLSSSVDLITVAITPGFVPKDAGSLLPELGSALGMAQWRVRQLSDAFRQEWARLSI